MDFNTVAHTLSEADITCGANITDITDITCEARRVYHIHTTCIRYWV